MKKKSIALLSALALTTAFGGLTTIGASAAVEDVPEAVVTSNVASGKDVTFRDLTDMDTTLQMYNYYPDGAGLEGTGCYEMDGETVGFRGGNHITDGESNDWSGYKVNSTYANVVGWAYLDMGAEYAVEKVKVHMLAAWKFKDVIVQVSNDPNFEEGVTTVFSSCESLTVGETVVYNGGLVGVTENTDLTGAGYSDGKLVVVSKQVDGNIFMANGAVGRYVRVTNNNAGNGGANSNTNLSELEVYVANSGLFAPKASVAAGSHESLTTVELSSGYDNAEIYYTLDGSYPTKESTKYEGAIDASAWTGAVVLRAIAVVDGEQSAAADYVYKITKPSENAAFGKMVSFRSLTDMSVEIAGGSYWPDATGFYGDLGGGMGTLTDGNATWESAQSRSPQTANTHAWAYLDLGKEIEIDNIQVGYLSNWCFTNVVIQVSNDSTFATGVTTVFSCTNETVYADDGETVVYNGGQVGCSTETKEQTGWNNAIGVDSVKSGLRTYDANGVKARYVRLTNSDGGNGGAFNVTTFTEIQVWSKAGEVVADPEIRDTVKSITTDVVSELKVTPGTTLDGVKASLPATVGYTTMGGQTKEAALNWASNDWAEMTAGTFTFTAIPVVEVDDVFEVVPQSYSVSVVVEKADTSELEALIAEVNALNGATYTVKTWQPLATLVSEAEQEISVITVTEEAIATYIEKITAAKAALQELATDKTALAQAVATANTIDKTKYMSATVVGLDEALATATDVNNDTDASVAEATAALSALNTILDGLVEKGDTTALAALVNEVKTANYLEGDYTELSYATLVDMLAEAEALLAVTGEIAKTEVDEAYTALENAKNGLVPYGNSAELAALISECTALTADDYTVDSWAALTKELNEASPLLTQTISQSVIDAAKAELQAAKDGLVSVVALKAAIASTIDETAYTAVSVQVWKDAKTEAALLLEIPNATAESIADAIAAIEAAKNALVEIPEDDNTGDDNTGDDNTGDDNTGDEGGSGCSASMSGAVVGFALAGAAVAALLKKKED